MRVLFVSKPVVPPWNDGSKNLVRDLACAMTRALPTVLVTPGSAPLGPRVTSEPVYRSHGHYAPGLTSNARVFARLMVGDPHDVWHFVFAPNPRSSMAARWARWFRARRGFRGPVVQMVASAPRHFDKELLFGDQIVLLSEWTRARFRDAGVPEDKMVVVPACVRAPDVPSPSRVAAMRALHQLGDAPYVLFPGDYEVSSGAATVADAFPALSRAVPEVHLVFACRPKTPRAASAREVISHRIPSELSGRVHHLGEVADPHALIRGAAALIFPVDDLYGKVDVPLVLLEALALGTPLVLARGGSLEEIQTARFVAPRDPTQLANEAAALFLNPKLAGELAREGQRHHAEHFQPKRAAEAYEALYDKLLGGRV